MISAAEEYRRQRILNLPPEHLTLMLYNGCIKFIDDGMEALGKKDYESANNSLQRAQRIISEFRLTLNFEYEIANQLLPLYNYIYDRLVEGNIKSDLAQIEEAKGIVTELRNAWVQAMKNYRVDMDEGKGGNGYA
jgi:flagellar protein FliS